MRNTTLYIMMGLGGLGFTTIMGYFTGQEMGVMAGLLGGIICFIPLIQLILTAKTKGFLPFFWNLEEENGIKKEKYCLIPNKFGRLTLIVAKIVGKDTLFAKRLGLIDDKGTEYAFGNSPLSFIQPRLGFTKNIKSAQYHSLLRRKKDIDDYEEAIKKYLGPEQYKTFESRFRQNPEPDANDINDEIQYLRNIKEPADPLGLTVFGETYTWDDDLSYFQYNYLPDTMQNFVDNEKINVRREEMGYKDPQKSIAWAKAVAIVVIAVVILLAVLSSLDLSKIGALFGGGA